MIFHTSIPFRLLGEIIRNIKNNFKTFTLKIAMYLQE